MTGDTNQGPTGMYRICLLCNQHAHQRPLNGEIFSNSTPSPCQSSDTMYSILPSASPRRCPRRHGHEDLLHLHGVRQYLHHDLLVLVERRRRRLNAGGAPDTVAGEELLWRVLGTGKCFRGLLRMTQWVPEVAFFKTASGVVGSSWKVPPQISIPRAACLGIKVYTVRKILAPGAGVPSWQHLPQYQSGKRQAR